MKKIASFAAVAALALMLVGGGCVVKNAHVSVGLSAGDSMLARQEKDGTFTKAEDNIFFPGEEIHTIIDGVTGFEKNQNGMSWLDIDIEIKENDSDTILYETHELLGENGKITLQEGDVAQPKALYRTPDDMAPGLYDFKVKVYDRQGDGHVTFTNTFELR